MNDPYELPSLWHHFANEGWSEKIKGTKKHNHFTKCLYERVVRIEGNKAIIEVAYDLFKEDPSGCITQERAKAPERIYEKHVGGFIKTLPYTDEMRKETARQSGRSTYQFGLEANPTPGVSSKEKFHRRKKSTW